MLKNILVLIAAIVLFLYGIGTTINHCKFMLSKETAEAKVLSIIGAKQDAPNEYKLVIKYMNMFNKAECLDTVLYKSNDSKSIPSNFTVLYNKENQYLFVDGQKRITWGLVCFDIIAMLLILGSAIVSIKKIITSIQSSST